MVGSQATLSASKTRAQRARLASSVWFQALVIGVLAFAFLLYRLGDASLWTDEGFSVNVARMSLGGIWQTFTGGEVNMVLYYALLHFWLKNISALGLSQTEFLIRVPAAFFGGLGAASVYLVAQRFLGLVAAVTATGVFLFNQQQLLASQEARSYSMQVFLVVVMWGCFFTLLRESSRIWWIAYVLSSVLACYAHAISSFVLVTQAGIFALLLILPTPFRPRMRELFRPMVGVFALILVLVLPLGLVSGGAAKVQWLGAPNPRDIVHAYMTLGPNGSKTFLAFLLVLCVAVGASAYALRGLGMSWLGAGMARWRTSVATLLARVNERTVLLASLVLWAVVPLILAYIISQIGPSYRYFSDAHLVMLVPALCLLLAFAVASVPWRPAAWGAGIAIVAIMALTLPQYYGLFHEDWRNPLQWVAQQYQPGDGIVCTVYAANTCDVPIFHYYPTNDPAVSSMLASAPQSADDATLTAYASRHPQLFFIIGSPTNDAVATQQKAVEAWLNAHYRLVTQYTGWIIVRLYDTTASATP